MRLILTLLPAALLLSALVGGCASENLEDLSGASVDAPCDTTAVATYSAVIRPVIERNHCLECHSTGGIGQVNSGFNYETAAGLKAAVTAGRLVGAIEHRVGFSPMPKDNAQMSACDIARIKQWIRRGAPAD